MPDIHLPKADGLALAKDKIVGKLPRGVIFMSVSVDPEKIKRASAIGSGAVPRKPCAEEELIADVERSLRNLEILAPTRIFEPMAGKIEAIA